METLVYIQYYYLKTNFMKPEFEKLKDTGMCPHGNFKDSCAACQEESKKTDERLSLEEAEKEAEIVREKAAEQKAERDTNRPYRDPNYDDLIKSSYAQYGIESAREAAWDEHLKEKDRNIENRKQKILQGEADQPTKRDYDSANDSIEERKLKARPSRIAKEAKDSKLKDESHSEIVQGESAGESNLNWAKQRAMEYAERNDLKGAIDSMVSDMNKDKSRPEMQKSMIVMMGMGLRNESNLTKEKVIEFIKGFN